MEYHSFLFTWVYMVILELGNNFRLLMEYHSFLFTYTSIDIEHSKI